MTGVVIEVVGQVAGQGSKRHVGGGRMIESSKRVAPWRQDVTAAALDAIAGDPLFFPMLSPVAVTVTFWFPRPKYHYFAGDLARGVREIAPKWQSKPPDIDKCLRSTYDALTIAGVWKDDAQVAYVNAMKRYATDRGTDCQSPGASIYIEALP